MGLTLSRLVSAEPHVVDLRRLHLHEAFLSQAALHGHLRSVLHAVTAKHRAQARAVHSSS